MNFGDLRNEVLNHGFDPAQFGLSRVNQYLNDGLALIARRVDYYGDEASSAISTVPGTASSPLPSGWGRVRSLVNTAANSELMAVGLRDIDRSPPSSGMPLAFAMDQSSLHLYPTPDSVYALLLRYWLMPPLLVNDADIPNLPLDWHHLLWVYACGMGYEAEDDPASAQYYMGRFNTELAELAADVKFPLTDYPTQVRSMWDSDSLSMSGWVRP